MLGLLDNLIDCLNTGAVIIFTIRLSLHSRTQVSLNLANSSTGDLDIAFAGKFEPFKDDMDAVLIFDGSSFMLEQLSGQVKTRCVAEV